MDWGRERNDDGMKGLMVFHYFHIDEVGRGGPVEETV